MIDNQQMSAIDRRVYAVVHGKKVVLDALAAAAKGWDHSSGHNDHHTFDRWRRGRWTLQVDWSEGGRINGASLHEDQIDPDTDKIRIRGDGSVVRYLRLGMVAGERQKKERLITLLSAAPDQIKDAINEVNAARIVDDRARSRKEYEENSPTRRKD